MPGDGTSSDGSFLGSPQAPLEDGKLEGISNDDFRQAAEGDVFGESLLQPSEEQNPDEGSRIGGEVDGRSVGGQQTWREQFLPAEQAVLRDYYEQN